jgi:spore cortex biosynthesis protein YabQ
VKAMVSENEFLLHSLIMGVFIPFVYDILRIIRRVIPHGSFWVSVEDMGFWGYCAAEVFLLMYHESNGTLRWFAVIGAMTGIFLYRKLVSSFFVKYGSRVIAWVLELLGKGLGLLVRPFRLMGRKAGGSARRLAGRQKRFLKNKLKFFLKVIKMNLKT